MPGPNTAEMPKKETRGGKSGRVPRSPLDHPANLQAHLQAATRMILGEPVKAVARELGLNGERSKAVATIVGQSVEDFRESARLKGQQILDKIEELALADIVALRPMERQIVYGIRMDKYRDLTGGTAPTVVHQTNIQVNGADRHTALGILSGKQAKAVQSVVAPPRVESNSFIDEPVASAT